MRFTAYFPDLFEASHMYAALTYFFLFHVTFKDAEKNSQKNCSKALS